MLITIEATDIHGINLQLTDLDSKYSSVKILWQRKIGTMEVAKIRVIDRKDEPWKI